QSLPLAQQPAIRPSHLLTEADAGTLEFQDISSYDKFIVQLCRRMVAGIDRVDDKNDIFPLQCALIKPESAHQLGARTLHVFQVVDVVNNTAGVGILEIDAGPVLERQGGCFSAHNVEPSGVLA